MDLPTDVFNATIRSFFCSYHFLSPKVKCSGIVSSLLKHLWKEMTDTSLFSVRRKSSWVVFLFSGVGEPQGSVSIHWTPSCFASDPW